MSDTDATPTIDHGVMPLAPRHAPVQSARFRSGLLDLASFSHYRRKKLIRAIEEKTKRRLLCYVSKGAINDFDNVCLAELLLTVEPGAHVTLLLDSPGGQVDAAERMVHILRETSVPPSGKAGDLEVVVPNSAKSAATLIALGADRILMSDSSELGPIDPQVRLSSGYYVSVFALLRAYKEAEQRCALLRAYKEAEQRCIEHPNNSAFAAELAKFDAILISEMRKAIERARTCAEHLLMRQGANYTKVSSDLMDVWRFPSHGQMIDWRTARDIGIPNVDYVDRDTTLWKQYWRLFRYLLSACGTGGRVLASLSQTITVREPDDR